MDAVSKNLTMHKTLFNNQNILVTGGSGFTGANLIKKLLELGARVRATLHHKNALILDERIEYMCCDLQDSDDCRRVCADMDVCFHCAAVTAGAGEMTKNPLFLLQPNVVMNLRLLEAAYEAKLSKFLFISSNTVYPVTDIAVKEDDANGEYFEKYFAAGWMKRFCEAACEMYSTKIATPMETIVVRPANLYGPLDNFDLQSSHVIPALIRKVVERHDPLLVWGDGMDIKDFLYIEDYVEGLILAMDKLKGFDVINLASGLPACLRDVLDIITRLDGYEHENVKYDSTKPTMIRKRLIDPTKARLQLGFSAKTSLENGLKKTIEWYRSTL